VEKYIKNTLLGKFINSGLLVEPVKIGFAVYDAVPHRWATASIRNVTIASNNWKPENVKELRADQTAS
jgi:hypothetical protein